MIILEDTRNKLVADSKTATKERDGKTRYQKRTKSHIANNVKQYNRLNMNDLFKKDIITISIEVRGETDNYLVKLSWGGVLEELKNELRRHNQETIELRNIVRALIISFNKNDVYIHCTCPDAQYRMNYWQTIKKISSGEPELRPSDETNPDDTLGSGCKHVMLVLANSSWIIKVASVIKNYIAYMELHRENMFATIIYPAIYGKKYEKPTQIDIEDSDKLSSEPEDIDTSNIEARKRGQFKAGNPYRFTKEDNDEDNNQITIFDSNQEAD